MFSVVAEPARLRREAMTILTDATHSDALTYQTYTHGGDMIVSSPLATSDMREYIGAFDGAALPEGAASNDRQDGWSIRNPLEIHRNKFSLWNDRDLEKIRRTETWTVFYGPFEITDQLRGLFYLEGKFIGYLAALKRGGERFDADSIRVASQMLPEIYDRLTLAWSIERAQAGERSMHLLVDDDGHVAYAGESAAVWLTPRRCELLRAMKKNPRIKIVDGMRASWMRLESEPRGLSYVSLSAAQVPTVDSWSRLSSSQARIARFAVEGLTNEEIAKLLNVSVSTVKYHLRRIFETLDIDSRGAIAARERSVP